MKIREKIKPTNLIDRTTFRVRFSEVDSMKVVWHGNYIKFFEDGRESFGKKYNLEYMSVYAKGYVIPLVDIQCQYKRSLYVGDTAIVETQFFDCDAAKIKFKYKIYRESDNQLVAEGESTQVFLNENNELELYPPQFYLDWKKQNGII